MRLRNVSILIAVVAIAIFSPFICGWLFQFYYEKQINFYSASRQGYVQIKSYHRGWLSSKVTLRVHINTNDIHLNGNFPSSIDFIVKQNIKHGPIFYKKMFFPIRFGLGMVRNTITLTTTGYTFSIIKAHTDGYSSEAQNQLSINREIDVEKLDFNNEKVGPLHLSVNGRQLNAKAVSDIFSAYHLFLQEGELYQGQLRSKLTLLLPQIFNPGTSLILNSLSFSTPNGRLIMEGKIIWPLASPSSPDDLYDFLHNAPLTFSIRASKLLVNELIKFASTLPYIQDFSREEKQRLLVLQEDVNTTFQQNNLLLERLIYFQFIPENIGNQLLMFAKDHELAESYLANIKTLFLNKQISPVIAYLLYFQFSQLERQVDLFDAMIDQHKKLAQEDMFFSLYDWIKQGYISQEKNDYVLLLTREKGEIKLNGKIFKD